LLMSATSMIAEVSCDANSRRSIEPPGSQLASTKSNETLTTDCRIARLAYFTCGLLGVAGSFSLSLWRTIMFWSE
jgi:hypothetical protein